MYDALQRLREQFSFSWQGLVNVLDVLLVTYVVYRVLKLVRGSRAWRLFLGILAFVALLLLSDFLGLQTLHWLLDKATLLAPVALAIIFLPELRQAIEGFGRLGVWSERLGRGTATMGANALEEVVAAVTEMAEQRTGALIVLERNVRLQDVADNGVPVRAVVTAPLLGAIFYDRSPLHDGAALIRGDQVTAAACRLPLSDTDGIDPQFHMRHRAGIGISEQADCVVVIVSEERGTVSVALEGRLIGMPSAQALRDLLNREMRGTPAPRPRKASSRPGPKLRKTGS